MIISPNDDEDYYKEALREILIKLRAKRNTDKEGETITSSARKQLNLLKRDGHPYRANDVFLLFAEKIHQFLSNNGVIDHYLEATNNSTPDYHMLSVDGKLYIYLLIEF